MPNYVQRKMRELNCMNRNRQRYYGSIESIVDSTTDDTHPRQRISLLRSLSFITKNKKTSDQQVNSNCSEFNKKDEKARLIMLNGQQDGRKYHTLIESDSEDDDHNEHSLSAIFTNHSMKKSVRFNETAVNSDNHLDVKKNKKKKKKSILKRTGKIIVRTCRLMTYGAPHMQFNVPYNDCNGPYHYDFYRNFDNNPYFDHKDYYDFDISHNRNPFIRYGEYGPTGAIYF